MRTVVLLLMHIVFCSCQRQQHPGQAFFETLSKFGGHLRNVQNGGSNQQEVRDSTSFIFRPSVNPNQQQQQQQQQQQEQQLSGEEDLSGRIGLVGEDLQLRPVPGSPFGPEGRQFSRPLPNVQHNQNLIRGTHHPDCYCADVGRCRYNDGFDGSGLIDIRIVNKHPNRNTHDGSTNSGYLSCNNGQQPCCPPQQPNVCPSAPLARSCGERTIIPVPGHKKLPGQAAFGAYPGQATVLRGDQQYAAAGALIDPNWVVTVAHRVSQYIRRPSQLKVRLGEWDASDPIHEPCSFQERQVQRIIIHRHFDSSSLRNDIALLRLSQPVDLQTAPHINSVCLPGIGEGFDGARCWLAGFGKNAFGASGNYSYILNEVDLSVVPTDRCQNQLRRTQLGPNFVLDRRSFICAGGEEGKDACEGDGGAPLVCLTDRGWTVAGLVAWGVGCARYNTPGVYVNMASYYNWIRRHTEYN